MILQPRDGRLLLIRQTDHAALALEWEKLQIPIKITVDDMPGLYVNNLKQGFRNAQSFKWQNFREAAIYCLTFKSHLERPFAAWLFGPAVCRHEWPAHESVAAIVVLWTTRQHHRSVGVSR